MNISREPYISKVVLSAGAVGPELEKAKKLLELVSGGKAQIIKPGPKILKIFFIFLIFLSISITLPTPKR